MKGDSKWYIDNHRGLLSGLEVTEKPDVKVDERYFSNSDKIVINEEGGLKSNVVPQYGQTFEEVNPTKALAAIRKFEKDC